MNEALAEDFDALVNETGASNRSEVFRRAIAAYKALMTAKKQGDSVLIVDNSEGGEAKIRELVAL